MMDVCSRKTLWGDGRLKRAPFISLRGRCKSLRRPCLIVGLAALTFGTMAVPAAAEHAPTIVVPGRPFTQVTRYGVDIRGAVVEGDWGLSRPGHGVVTVYGGWVPIGRPYGGYFPATGRPPRYGRDEVLPARRKRASETTDFRRVWSAESAADVPAVPPAVIETPLRRQY